MKNNNLLLLLALTMFALAGNAQESPLQDRFDEQYRALAAELGQRQDAAMELKQAKDVWLSTRKRLIAVNAKIDAKKLDVSVSSGEQQSRAIDELVAMGGLRDRTLLDGIDKLQKIRGGEEITRSPIGSVEVEAGNPDKQKAGSGKSGVSFTIEPEDVNSSGLP